MQRAVILLVVGAAAWPVLTVGSPAHTQSISAGALVRTAQTALEKALTPYAGHYTLAPLGRIPDAITLAGRAELSAASPAGTLLRPRLAVPVAISVNGQQVESIPVWFSLAVRQPVLVFVRDLPAGSNVTAADVRTQDVDVTRLYGTPLRSADRLVNLSLRVPVVQGGAAVMRDFEPTPEVRRNQRVRVLVQSGHIMVLAEGKAEETGHTGDEVSVLVDGAAGPCDGRVIGKGVVKIDY